MIKAIIFDFDGVIADSNNVKTEAFVKLFENYPKHIKESVRKFHLQNGGMSRFDKFRYIYANFLNETLSKEMFNQLCTDFGRLVIDGVINAPLMEGVKDFLERNKNVYKLYIISGTPQDEIREVVKRKGLDTYFFGVYGAPGSKKELIEGVLKKDNFAHKEAIFLGDSINDYEGAKGAGVEFVAKVSDNLEFDLFPDISLTTKINTMDEFERYLDKKNEESK